MAESAIRRPGAATRKGRHAYGFTKEDDIGLDEAVALGAPRDLPRLEGVPHLVAVEFAVALYAVLAREATVRLDDLVARHARAPLERIDVLREARVQQLVVAEQAHEGVRRRGPETPG